MKICIFNEPKVPDADFIQQTLAEFYPVSRAESWAELAQELKPQEPTVVIFTSPPEKLTVQVTQIKAMLPVAACISVITQEEAQKISGYQFDLDFLLVPITRFEILSRVSTAVRQTEMLNNVEATAQLDEVTQLYNRRYFINRLNEEISLSRRHMSPLAVMVFGVNFFQMYLDSYGYNYVNELIRHIALVIQNHKRQEDIIARISDDEIGLLLPHSTPKGARPLADRIIHTIQGAPHKYGEVEEEITVHSGVAGYPSDGSESREDMDADALIRYARHALHNARCSSSKSVQVFSEIKPAL